MSWDNLWDSMADVRLGNAEPFTWAFYKELVNGFNFRGKRVLEIGCGTGVNSLMMAKLGAKVTFLDKSKESLDIVRKNLDMLGLDGELVLGDVFDLKFRPEFDLVHSEGVIEHFLGKRRQDIVDIHADVLKGGGKAVIIVPNRKCLPYRIGKGMCEVMGVWPYGKEWPYSRQELKARMERAGLRIENATGGEFIFSFGWLASPIWLTSPYLLKKTVTRKSSNWIVKMNYGSRYAKRFGRIIGAVGVKE